MGVKGLLAAESQQSYISCAYIFNIDIQEIFQNHLDTAMGSGMALLQQEGEWHQRSHCGPLQPDSICDSVIWSPEKPIPANSQIPDVPLTSQCPTRELTPPFCCSSGFGPGLTSQVFNFKRRRLKRKEGEKY